MVVIGEASSGAMRRARWTAALGLAIFFFGAMPPPAPALANGPMPAPLPQAIPVDGQAFGAQLTAIDAQWQLTFRTPQGRRVAPGAGLVSWGDWRETAQRPIVLLADGGLLVARVPAVAKGDLACESRLFGRIALPLERVAGVLFAPPADRLGRDLAIDRIASATGPSDRLLLTNGDELKGSVLSLQDGKIRLRAAAGPGPSIREIEVRRVASVIFNPMLTRRDTAPAGDSRRTTFQVVPAARRTTFQVVSADGRMTFQVVPRADNRLRAWVGFTDGSRLLARGLVLDEKSLAVTSPSGFTWRTSPKELVALQPLGGQATYLSDLKAAKYEPTPFLTLKWPYHADRSVSGGLLRAGGRLHLKGLGVHSAARLTYALDAPDAVNEPYRRFQAELAIDDETGGRGSVIFRVLVDDQARYTSPIVRGGQSPLPVSVDVAGAKRLDLIVEFADRADELDHADWLGARLVR
jgi:hypothetical protein